MKVTPKKLLGAVLAITLATVVAYQVVAPIAADEQAARLEAFRNKSN